MVFDVARPLDVAGHAGAALELVEDGPVGFGHHGREHVQTAAVGHAEHHFVDAQGPAALDDLLHGRNHGLAAVEAEPLGPGEAFVQEAFEALGLDQLVQDRQLALAGEGVLLELVRSLDARLQPGLLLRLGDMHVLDADGAAVGAFQQGHDLADRTGLQAQHAVQIDRAIEVGLGEAVEFGGQLGIVDRLFDAQRIQLGMQVTADAIAADQHQHPDGIMGGGADLVDRGPRRGGGSGNGGGDRGRPLARHGTRRRPATVEHARLLGRFGDGAATPGPGVGRSLHRGGTVAQLVKEGAPFTRDRGRIIGPFLVQILDERGVCAIQEAGLGKDLIQPTGIVRHRFSSVPWARRAQLRDGRRRPYKRCFLMGHDRMGAKAREFAFRGTKSPSPAGRGTRFVSP